MPGDSCYDECIPDMNSSQGTTNHGLRSTVDCFMRMLAGLTKQLGKENHHHFSSIHSICCRTFLLLLPRCSLRGQPFEEILVSNDLFRKRGSFSRKPAMAHDTSTPSIRRLNLRQAPEYVLAALLNTESDPVHQCKLITRTLRFNIPWQLPSPQDKPESPS